MKYLKIFSIASLAIMSLTSCEKDLDQQPLSSVTTENFFTTKNDFIQGCNAVYAVGLRGASGSSYGYPDRQLNLSEIRSDNLYAVTDIGSRGWEGINELQSNLSTHSYVSEAWVNNYRAIDKANIFLEKLAAGGRTIIADDVLANRMEAEVKFLRAFLYFDLVRWFGKVPIVDKTITTQQATTIPRSAVTDVYTFLMKDFQHAIDSLPLTYTVAADKGRATKWAARYMMALVHMTRSAPTYGIEGPGLGLNEWSQAYALLNQIVATPTSGFDFVPLYSNIYSYTNESNNGNKEVIFDVQYHNVQAPTASTAVGGAFVWKLTPDTYFQSIGISAQGSIYQKPISNDFLSKFQTTDVRRVFGIQTGFTWPLTPIAVYNDYSFYKKYIDKSKYGSGGANDWPINFIVATYTDALLLRAECTLHSGGGTQAEVDAAVNKVRGRAGIPTITNVGLDSLFAERRREFHGEGKRWHDLVRSGKIVETMNAWRAADDAVKKLINPMVPNFIIYPVPNSELNIAPGLYQQNPGYD
ncbi:MAG: RagB/SusD family nutrient uptake outer membrane protein [Chitinophagaceae bacterium]|nr:MAG: RagB/SusD family nutrient uptake outer membrane protein [Chitinophagaceae bacterium]